MSVRDLSSGRVFSYEPGLRTATASVVKVDIAVALLLGAQRERRGLTAAERDLAERMIKVSDNAAATALWSAIGGAGGLNAANRRLGLRDTTAGPGGAWGSTTTSAADQVRLLAALTADDSPLTTRNRRYVLSLMVAVAPEQAWGVGAAAPGGTALKNGWLPREVHGGRWTINSMGLVRDGDSGHLVAVLSERHASMAAGVGVVEHVCELVGAALRTTAADAR